MEDRERPYEAGDCSRYAYCDSSHNTRLALPTGVQVLEKDVEIQCNSENSTQFRMSTRQTYTYRVKVVNRAKKSEYVIKRLQYTGRFGSTDDLRAELQSIDVATKDIGYIEPGHGAKGKQVWLGSQEELDEMYMLLDKKIKREILLWCYPLTTTSRKRPLSPSNSDSNSTGTKRNASSQKLHEIEKIVKELQEKHASHYSIEKLNAWAHLLHIGKHDSYETAESSLLWQTEVQWVTKGTACSAELFSRKTPWTSRRFMPRMK